MVLIGFLSCFYRDTKQAFVIDSNAIILEVILIKIFIIDKLLSKFKIRTFTLTFG